MFVHSSTTAPTSGCAADEGLAGVENVAFGQGGVERVLLVEHHLGEFAPAIGADDRGRGVGAGGGEMLRRQARGAHGQDADPLARRQDALDQRDLHRRLEAATGTRTCAASSR